MRRESLLVGCALIGTLTLFSGCRTAQKSNEKQILTKIESNADESASENKTSKQNVLGEPTGSIKLIADGVKSFSLGDLSESYGDNVQSASKPSVYDCKKAAILLAPYLSGGFEIC